MAAILYFGGLFDYAEAEIFALDYYLYHSSQVTFFVGEKVLRNFFLGDV